MMQKIATMITTAITIQSPTDDDLGFLRRSAIQNQAATAAEIKIPPKMTRYHTTGVASDVQNNEPRKATEIKAASVDF